MTSLCSQNKIQTPLSFYNHTLTIPPWIQFSNFTISLAIYNPTCTLLFLSIYSAFSSVKKRISPVSACWNFPALQDTVQGCLDLSVVIKVVTRTASPIHTKLCVYLHPVWITLWLAEDLLVYVSITQLLLPLMITPMFPPWHLRQYLAHNGCPIDEVEFNIVEFKKKNSRKHQLCLNPNAHSLQSSLLPPVSTTAWS